jgi:16S rRNA (adenine1518-N6/adenine1519-N6)-dimethyltransferase
VTPEALAPANPPVRRDEIRARLASLGVRPSKGSGQSFLTDPFLPDIEVALLEVPRGTPVVEVGGGLGALTAALLRRGVSPLRVIERDPRLARHLRELVGDRAQVVEEDALTLPFDPTEAVIGNLPFSSATPLLMRLFALRPPRIVALVQREVGERLAAKPGSTAFGRPTILAALYGTVETFARVPSRSFEPEPAVEGIVLRFTPRNGALPVLAPLGLEEITRRLFAWRRKQLGNSLPAVVGGESQADHLGNLAGWPSDWRRRRPEELAPELYFALARAMESRRQSASPAG